MKFSVLREASDRITNGISRHTLQVADDTQLLQEITHNGFDGESAQTIEHAHPYGFSAHPKKPSMVGGVMRYAVAFMGFLGGSRSHAVAFAVSDRRHRLYKMQEGEVALHDDRDTGQWVYLRRNGTLIKAPNANSITIQIDQSSSGGSSSGMGQDATQIPSAATSIKQTKNGVVVTVGDATLFVANDFIVGHVNDSRMVVNSAGTKIKKGSNVIFVDDAGCWSTSAINIKADSIPDGTDPT